MWLIARRHVMYHTERLKTGARKNSVWATRQVALQTFYRQILSFAYRFFPPSNFRPPACPGTTGMVMRSVSARGHVCL